MLTPAQREEFVCTGLLRLPGAVPRPDALAVRDRIWTFLSDDRGIERDDPATWTNQRPHGFQRLSRSGAYRPLWNRSVFAAVEDLVGPCRPREPGRLLLTFPQPGGAWDVPADGWHIDIVPVQDDSGVRSVQAFVVLSTLRSQGGGTLVLAGSHRLVANYAAKTGQEPRARTVRTALGSVHPWLRELWNGPNELNGSSDRIQRFMREGGVVDGVPVRVVEVTGEPGDVYLMHSDSFHAGAPNRRQEPRIMVTAMVGRAHPTGKES